MAKYLLRSNAMKHSCIKDMFKKNNVHNNYPETKCTSIVHLCCGWTCLALLDSCCLKRITEIIQFGRRVYICVYYELGLTHTHTRTHARTHAHTHTHTHLYSRCGIMHNLNNANVYIFWNSFKKFKDYYDNPLQACTFCITVFTTVVLSHEQLK